MSVGGLVTRGPRPHKLNPYGFFGAPQVWTTGFVVGFGAGGGERVGEGFEVGAGLGVEAGLGRSAGSAR